MVKFSYKDLVSDSQWVEKAKELLTLQMKKEHEILMEIIKKEDMMKNDS